MQCIYFAYVPSTCMKKKCCIIFKRLQYKSRIFEGLTISFQHRDKNTTNYLSLWSRYSAKLLLNKEEFPPYPQNNSKSIPNFCSGKNLSQNWVWINKGNLHSLITTTKKKGWKGKSKDQNCRVRFPRIRLVMKYSRFIPKLAYISVRG